MLPKRTPMLTMKIRQRMTMTDFQLALRGTADMIGAIKSRMDGRAPLTPEQYDAVFKVMLDVDNKCEELVRVLEGHYR